MTDSITPELDTLRFLQYETHDRLAYITLNRPAKRNALSANVVTELKKAFEQADADEQPGLRLWWEYLECVNWDEKFYDMMVKEQRKWTAKEGRWAV